jgi:hypothetical protein
MYNNIMKVRDLLNPASNVKGGLKVREHPSRGFYGMFFNFTLWSHIIIRYSD